MVLLPGHRPPKCCLAGLNLQLLPKAQLRGLQAATSHANADTVCGPVVSAPAHVR